MESYIFEIDQNPGEIEIHQFNYVKGLCKLYNNEIEAVDYIEQFLSEYSGRYYKSAALQKLSWFYFLNNNIEKHNSIKAQLKIRKSAILEQDKQAIKEALDEDVNPVLLEARILFDAGKYKEVTNMLNNHKDDFSISDKTSYITYHYRLARALHMQKKYFKALEYYKYVIDNSIDLNNHYEAFSLLQIGSIYEDLKMYDKAEKYFNKCLSVSNRSYNLSIEFKAKIAADRINNIKNKTKNITKI